MTMDIFVSGRGGGKTSRIVLWAAESPSRVVVTADNAAGDVVAAYLEKELDSRFGVNEPGEHRNRARGQVVTAWSIRGGSKLGRRTEVAFDDVDAVLAELIHATPAFATLTGTLTADTSRDPYSQVGA